MSAQTLTLARVKNPLEQRAEYRRLDVGPVQLVQACERADFLPPIRPDVIVLEQVAVEVGNILHHEVAAGVHDGEQIAQVFTEGLVIALAFVYFYHLRKRFLRKKTNVGGEHAEQDVA